MRKVQLNLNVHADAAEKVFEAADAESPKVSRSQLLRELLTLGWIAKYGERIEL